MDEALEEIGRRKLVPVVAPASARDSSALGDALVGGGLPVVEVAFRTEAAGEAVRLLAGRGDLLVGAGTVLTSMQAELAIEAGARFVVSPGISLGVIEFCREAGVPVVPGVCTPTEVMRAMEMGLEVLKFFPAEALGGPKTLETISAPLGSVRFIPTGGINAANLRGYLELPVTFACGGTWMVPSSMIWEGRFEEITRLCREAVEIAAGTVTGR